MIESHVLVQRGRGTQDSTVDVGGSGLGEGEDEEDCVSWPPPASGHVVDDFGGTAGCSLYLDLPTMQHLCLLAGFLH